VLKSSERLLEISKAANQGRDVQAGSGFRGRECNQRSCFLSGDLPEAMVGQKKIFDAF